MKRKQRFDQIFFFYAQRILLLILAETLKTDRITIRVDDQEHTDAVLPYTVRFFVPNAPFTHQSAGEQVHILVFDLALGVSRFAQISQYPPHHAVQRPFGAYPPENQITFNLTIQFLGLGGLFMGLLDFLAAGF